MHTNYFTEIKMTLEQLVEEYIHSLSEIEKIAYQIAKDNLKTSFDIERSLGFKEWLKNKKS